MTNLAAGRYFSQVIQRYEVLARRCARLIPAAMAALVSGCASAPPPAGNVAGPVDIVVAATTDVHGRLRGWDYYANASEATRGLSRAATIVDSLRAAHPGRVILLDAGDLLQGNPLAYVAARVRPDRGSNPIVAAMNVMGYDAAAIGNHEYNYGVPYLDSIVRQARFPFLSANTYRLNPAGIHAYRAWTIVERQGVKVGIVGATTPGVMVWDAENVRGRLRVGDIIPAVREAVGEVRAAGAQVVLVTVHSGLNEPASYDTVATGLPSENVAGRIAREIPGIDLIVYGHSHRESRGSDIGSTRLIQAKNWATSVAVAHLNVTRGAEGVRVTAGQSSIVQVAGHQESAQVLATTDEAHRETVAYVTTTIGNAADTWSAAKAREQDTPLIDFILEAQRKETGADLSSTAAFSTDASIPAGPITIAQVAQLYPYENTLRSVRITGAQLREYLEFSSRYYRTVSAEKALSPDPKIPGYNFDIVSGVNYVVDVSRPIGSRIARLDYKGAPVRDTDTFTMALNNYRQTGGGGFAMLRDAPVVYDKQTEIRQLLIDEVKRRGTLRSEDYLQRNWSLSRGAATTSDATASNPTPAQGVPLRVPPPAFPTGTRFLRIIGTNDFHGALEPRPDRAGVRRGGAAYVAAAIDAARRECANRCVTLLLDGGDMFQGTLASNLAFGRPVVEYYDAIGYAAAALGNHEFDWGVDTLRARIRQARYAILGANVRYLNGRDVEWIRNDTIVQRGPVKVGIIGVSTVTTPTQTMSRNVVGLRFDDPAPIVDSIGIALRARGADYVVVVAHAGAFCNRDNRGECSGEIVDLAKRVRTRVDAIVSGHTHSLLNTIVNDIPILQAYNVGRAIGILDIPLGPRAGTSVARMEIRDIASDTLKPHPTVEAIVTRAMSRVSGQVNRRITTFSAQLTRQGNQYALGNLIADAQRWAGKGDVAIMNNGGIRTDVRAGVATYGSLYELQPFGNGLTELTMTGAQLRGLIELMVADEPDDHVSGMGITYNPEKPKGSRLVSVTMSDGSALSNAKTYTVIVNDFLATGGTGYRAGGRASASRSLGMTDLNALIDYLGTLPVPVVAPARVRISAVTQ